MEKQYLHMWLLTHYSCPPPFWKFHEKYCNTEYKALKVHILSKTVACSSFTLFILCTYIQLLDWGKTKFWGCFCSMFNIFLSNLKNIFWIVLCCSKLFQTYQAWYVNNWSERRCADDLVTTINDVFLSLLLSCPYFSPRNCRVLKYYTGS